MLEMNPKVLLITPFSLNQRGNTLTTQRICTGLSRHGVSAQLFSLESDHYLERLKLLLDQRDFNIIHAFNGTYLGQLLNSLPEMRRYPLIITLTGTDINLDMKHNPLAFETVFKLARQIIVFHPDFKKQLLARYQQLCDKITVIPQGIALPPSTTRSRREYGLPEDSLLFLLPSGLRPVKNITLALNGLKLLARQKNLFNLSISGPILDQPYAKEILLQLEALPWATYLGEISHDKISGLYRLGDVVINCSHAEGQPQAVLEAMSLGIPAILSKVPGNQGIIEHGREGFYVSNEAEFFLAAQTLLKEPLLRQQMGLAASRLVKNRFNLDREISSHIKLYYKVLQKNLKGSSSLSP